MCIEGVNGGIWARDASVAISARTCPEATGKCEFMPGWGSVSAAALLQDSGLGRAQGAEAGLDDASESEGQEHVSNWCDVRANPPSSPSSPSEHGGWQGVAAQAEVAAPAAPAHARRVVLRRLAPGSGHPRPRRGRPQELLRDARAEALEELAVLADAPSLAGPAANAAANGQAATSVAIVPHGVANPAAPPALLPAMPAAPFRPLWRNGFCTPSSLGEVLAQYADLGKAPKAVLDSSAKAIANEYVFSSHVPVASRVVQQRLLELDRSAIPRHVRRLANSAYLLARHARANLEELICKYFSQGSKLFYVEFCMYDETPMATKVADDPSKAHAFKVEGMELERAALPILDDSIDAPPLREAASLGQHAIVRRAASSRLLLLREVASSSAPGAKLLQIRQEFAMVLRVRGRYIGIVGVTPDSICCLERNTPECIKAAVAQSSATTRFSSSFQQKVRLTCLDRHPSNDAAERALVASRAGWGALRTHCEVHMTGTIFSKTFSFMEEDVAGLIHANLSVGLGAMMSKFRRCVKLEVASRVDIYHGAVPKPALDFKQVVIRLFLATAAEAEKKAIMLLASFTGDWRDTARIPVHVDGTFMEGWPRERVVALLQVVVVNSCCSAKFVPWNRHRWGGADCALDPVGMLECLHGLWRHAYRRFVRTFGKGESALAAAEASVSELGGGDQPAAGHTDDAGDARAEGGDAGTDPMDPASWAKINDRHRQRGDQWAATDPMGRIVLMRLVMTPLRELLHAQFEMASGTWEVRQQAKVAKCLQDGLATEQARSYRLQVSANMLLERRALEQLHMLFARGVWWDIVPRQCYTLKFRCLCFRMLSRVGCMIEHYLREPHRQFPVRMFVLVDTNNPSLASDIRNEAAACPLLLDDFTQAMLKEHPSWHSCDFMVKLRMIALKARADITPIECRHASIRRILEGRSVQTHRLSLVDLGAEWVLQQIRLQRYTAGGETALAKKPKAHRKKRKAISGSKNRFENRPRLGQTTD